MLGRALRKKGIYNESALDNFEKAWLLDSKEDRQFNLYETAFMFFGRKDFQGAVSSFYSLEDELCVYQGDPDEEGDFLFLLGIALLKKGAYAESSTRFEKALSIYRRLNYDLNEIYALLALGIAYSELQQQNKSQNYLKLAAKRIHLCYLNNARPKLFILKTLLVDQEKLKISTNDLFQQLLQDFLEKSYVLVDIKRILQNKPELIKEAFLIWGPQDIHQLTVALKKNTYLQEIELDYCNYYEADDEKEGVIPDNAQKVADQLTLGLSQHISLKRIKLVDISIRTLAAITNHIGEFKSLEKLIIEKNKFNPQSTKVFSNLLIALEKAPALTAISLDFSFEEDKNSGEIAALISLIAKNKLKEISLSNTNLSIDHCHAVSKILALQMDLETLIINSIGKASCDSILLHFTHLKKSIKSFVFFHSTSSLSEKANCIIHLANLVADNTSVESLKISINSDKPEEEIENKLILKSMEQLVIAFKKNTSITELSCFNLFNGIMSDSKLGKQLQEIEDSVIRNKQKAISKTPSSVTKKRKRIELLSNLQHTTNGEVNKSSSSFNI